MRRRDLLTGIVGTVAATTLGAGASLMPGAAARAAGSGVGTFRLGWRWPERLAPKRRPPEIYSHMEQWYGSLFWTGLTRFSPSGDWTVEPALALEWTPANGAREWRFRIRDDAIWHTGAPVTAAQCAASLNELTHPDAPSRPGYKYRKRHRLIYPVTWRAIDATTLASSSEEPEWSLPALLARPAYCIVDTESPITPKNAAQVVGNGSFRCVEWQIEKGIIGERFAEYFDPARPQIQEITAKNYEGWIGKDQVKEFFDDRIVDATGPVHLVNSFEIVREKLRGRATLVKTILTSYHAVVAASRHTDPAVIAAIKAILPREEIASNQWNGQGAIGADHTVSDGFGLDLELDPVTEDPDRAKHLLAQAGIDRIRLFEERVKYRGTRVTAHKHAEALTNAFARIGVKVKRVTKPIDARQRTGRKDVVWIQRKSEGDAVHSLWHLYGGPGTRDGVKRANWETHRRRRKPQRPHQQGTEKPTGQCPDRNHPCRSRACSARGTWRCPGVQHRYYCVRARTYLISRKAQHCQ